MRRQNRSAATWAIAAAAFAAAANPLTAASSNAVLASAPGAGPEVSMLTLAACAAVPTLAAAEPGTDRPDGRGTPWHLAITRPAVGATGALTVAATGAPVGSATASQDLVPGKYCYSVRFINWPGTGERVACVLCDAYDADKGIMRRAWHWFCPLILPNPGSYPGFHGPSPLE